jgi:uncharacterized protein
VAGIVKLDDAGLALVRRPGAAAQAIGRAILAAAPWLMRALSVAGTAAMFLVGGSIVTHGIGPLHHVIEAHAPGLLGWLAHVAVGLAVGAVVLGGVLGAKRVRRAVAT